MRIKGNRKNHEITRSCAMKRSQAMFSYFCRKSKKTNLFASAEGCTNFCPPKNKNVPQNFSQGDKLSASDQILAQTLPRHPSFPCHFNVSSHPSHSGLPSHSSHHSFASHASHACLILSCICTLFYEKIVKKTSRVKRQTVLSKFYFFLFHLLFFMV